VTGYIKEKKVRRTLVDGGSAINIMPKSTINDLGITVEELSKSRMMIQGINLEGQRAIGMIHIELIMGDLLTSAIFHVIDAKTSYRLLLGRPWLHEYGIVAFTLHHCLKYYPDGEKKINGDIKPFTKAESHFTDARFFEEGTAPKKTMPSTISFTGKGGAKKAPQAKMMLLSNNLRKKQVSNTAPLLLFNKLLNELLLQQDQCHQF